MQILNTSARRYRTNQATAFLAAVAVGWLFILQEDAIGSGVTPAGIELVAADDQSQFLGWSVAVDSGIAVAGAYGLPLRFPDRAPGSAYVFVRDGTNWNQQARLTASDPSISDYFGSAVGVSFQTIVAGAYNNDSHIGSAYVFVRDGTNWIQQAKLTGWSRHIDDAFGSAVAIDAETILVGVPQDERACTNRHCDTGSAYVFVRVGTNWLHQARLIAGDPADHDYFGTAVAINGNTAVVTRQGSGGSAHVFVRQGWKWTEQAKLVGDVPGEGFGASVAIQGDRIIVGSTSFEGSNSGFAYIFERSGTNWVQTTKLEASDPAAYRYFGSAVALSGNQALIGSPGSGVFTTGAAYLFEFDGISWTERASFSNEVPFGRSVALHGGVGLVGDPANNNGCPDTSPRCHRGAALLFALNPPPAVNVHRIDPTASEAGLDTAQFKVTRSGNTNEGLRVFYQLDGTATPGVDYLPLRGFATIAAGKTSALFKLIPIDDSVAENPETVKLTLLPDPAYNLTQPFRANITILDDDSTP